MRRALCAAVAALLLVDGSYWLARLGAASMIPTRIGRTLPQPQQVGAWQPFRVDDSSGATLWCVANRPGIVLTPWLASPPTPAPGPPIIPPYLP